MRTAHIILVALLSGCIVAFDGCFGKRLLDIIKALRQVNTASKKNLNLVTSDSVHSGSRGLLQKFETVSQALAKVDGFVSALESGSKALPFPSVQQARHYLPVIRTFLKAGHDTIDSVVKAQREIANGSNSTAFRDLTGSLGFAKNMVSSVMGMFKKLKPSGGGGFAERLKEFALTSPTESQTPGEDLSSQGSLGGVGTAPNLGNSASASAQATYSNSGYSPSSSIYSPSSSVDSPSSSLYSPGSSLYSPGSSLYSPGSSLYSPSSSLYSPGSSLYSPSSMTLKKHRLTHGLGSSDSSGYPSSSSIFSPSSSLYSLSSSMYNPSSSLYSPSSTLYSPSDYSSSTSLKKPGLTNGLGNSGSSRYSYSPSSSSYSPSSVYSPSSSYGKASASGTVFASRLMNGVPTLIAIPSSVYSYSAS